MAITLQHYLKTHFMKQRETFFAKCIAGILNSCELLVIHISHPICKWDYSIKNLFLFPSQSPKDPRPALDLCLIFDSSSQIRDRNPLDGSYDNFNLMKEFVALLSRQAGKMSRKVLEK